MEIWGRKNSTAARAQRTVGTFALLVALLAAGCGSSSSSSTTRTTQTQASGAQSSSAATQNTSKQIPPAAASAAGKPLTVRLLAKLPPEHRPSGSQPHLVGLTGSLSDQLLTIAGDAGAFWQKQASTVGAQIPPTTVTVVDQTPATCGTQTIATGDPDYYCFLNNTVLLTLAYINKYYVPIGNVAVAEDVGELYGLHVLEVLGLYKLLDAHKLTHVEIWRAGACMSGAWMYTVYQRKLFSPGDLQALGKLFASYAGNGTTAQDWVTSFDTGFQTGDPSKCIPAAAAAP